MCHHRSIHLPIVTCAEISWGNLLCEWSRHTHNCRRVGVVSCCPGISSPTSHQSSHTSLSDDLFCILRVSKKDEYRFCMEPGYSYKGRHAFGNRSAGVVGKSNGWMTEEKSSFLFSFCQCRIPPGKALCSQEWCGWRVLVWDQLLPME